MSTSMPGGLGKRSRIRHIVRLRQVLRRWRSKARMSAHRIPSDVPAGTRGGVRGQQLQEICGARHVPEPPRLQKATGPGRGRVRILQPRSSRHPLRRSALRTTAPLHFTLRFCPHQPLRRLPRGSQKQPRLLPRISAATPLINLKQHYYGVFLKHSLLLLYFTPHITIVAIHRRMLRRWQAGAIMVHPVVPGSNRS
ncbi:indole-3-acetic acid-induced protein ARG7 [Spatholobus suberectus]|nr:indole-3-acetic acid-induced protein ARG7 [Spatholobus suberectus]